MGGWIFFGFSVKLKGRFIINNINIMAKRVTILTNKKKPASPHKTQKRLGIKKLMLEAKKLKSKSKK
jgi:hypothetical protein